MIYFEKRDRTIRIVQGKSVYTFCRHTNQNINLDTWRMYSGEVNGKMLWDVTDIEGPIKQVGTNDFIGGCHGDEKYREIHIILNGKLVEEEQDIPLTEMSNVTIFVVSDVYFCDDSENVAFIRYKKLEFLSNKLVVSNKWKYIGDEAFYVECFTGCGLYSVYKDLLLGYSTDYDSELINDRESAPSSEIEKICFYGEDFLVTLRMLSGKGRYYEGCVADFASEKRPRFKGYLHCIGRGKGECVLQKNDELRASFEIQID